MTSRRWLSSRTERLKPPRRPDAAAASPGWAADKDLLIVPGAGHAVSYLVDGEAYREKSVAFLDKHFPKG